jgi:hypothetical protein
MGRNYPRPSCTVLGVAHACMRPTAATLARALDGRRARAVARRRLLALAVLDSGVRHSAAAYSSAEALVAWITASSTWVQLDGSGKLDGGGKLGSSEDGREAGRHRLVAIIPEARLGNGASNGGLGVEQWRTSLNSRAFN